MVMAMPVCLASTVSTSDAVATSCLWLIDASPLIGEPLPSLSSKCASAEETALELLGALKYPENEDGEQGVEYSEDDCMVEFW